MVKKLLVVAASVATVSLGVAALADASHSWAGHHWARTSNPFTLKVGDNVGASWDASLATASADWSRSTVLNTVVVPGSVRPRTCKAILGRVQVFNAVYGSTPVGWGSLRSP